MPDGDPVYEAWKTARRRLERQTRLPKSSPLRLLLLIAIALLFWWAVLMMVASVVRTSFS